MAIKVGTLQVDLVANTATFTGPLDKAGEHAKKTAKDIETSFNSMDTGEARGGLLLIDELIGVHIPRHAAAFASQIPGFATALAALFPIAAVAAIGVALVDATEKAAKHREEIEKSKTASLDAAAAMGRHAEALDITRLKVQDQLAILEKRPAQNGIQIAMLEGKKAVDELIDEFDKAINKMSDLLGKQRQGMWDKLFNGDHGANDVIDQAQKFKTAIDDLIQQRTTAELKGDKTAADNYKAQLDTRVAAFHEFLKTQQTAVDNERNAGIGKVHERAAKSSVPVSDENMAALEKQVNDEFKERQSILNNLAILMQGFTSSEKEQAQITAANVAIAKNVPVIDLTRLERAGVLKKQISKLTEEQATAEEKARDALAGYFQKVESGAQKQGASADEQLDKMIRTDDEMRSISESQAAQNIKLQIATGQLTAQAGAAQMLKLLETDRTSAIGDINSLLSTQLAKVKALSDATMGGLIGSPQQRQAFVEAVNQYQKMKEQQLQVEKTYNQKISAEQDKLAQGFQGQFGKMMAGWQDVNKNMGGLFMNTMNSFSDSLAKFVTTGQGNWRQFAASAVESLVRIEIQRLIGFALHQSLAEKEKLIDAKKAFRGAYAATSDIPIIGPALAPIAGAAAFAAVMAFEQGGIVPQDTYAMVHKQEMVLPAHISNFIMNAAGGSTGDGSGGHHFVYAPTVHAVDAEGVDRMLTKHGDTFNKHVNKHLRRMNLG